MIESKKEIYLYGTLLALVREQLDAFDKQVTSGLGFWARARLGSRTKEMQKFVFKILTIKAGNDQSMADAIEGMAADLEAIESDRTTWADIRPQELDYLRSILSQLA